MYIGFAGFDGSHFFYNLHKTLDNLTLQLCRMLFVSKLIRDMIFLIMWSVRPAKPQISLRIRAG